METTTVMPRTLQSNKKKRFFVAETKTELYLVAFLACKGKTSFFGTGLRAIALYLPNSLRLVECILMTLLVSIMSIKKSCIRPYTKGVLLILPIITWK